MNRLYSIAIFLLFISIQGKSQNVNSILMLEDCHFSQAYNPAYYSNPEGITIGIPLLNNTNFANFANFKLTNFITKNSDGSNILSLDEFENNSNKFNLRNSFEIPYLYINFKYKKRYIGITFKESFFFSTEFEGSAFDLFNNGNNSELFFDHKSRNIKVDGLSFRELSANFTEDANDYLVFGYRPKIVFGMALAHIENFEYRIVSDEEGKSVTIYSQGEGNTSFPLRVIKDDSSIYKIDSDNKVTDYLSTFRNPGLALDLGVDYQISDNRKVAFSLINMGFIWFNYKSYNLKFDTEYKFEGFEVTANPSEEYVNNIKSEFQDALRPTTKNINFIHFLPVTFIAHYKEDIRKNIDIGLTNQLTYYHHHIFNTSVFSVRYKIPYLDLIGNINAYNLNQFSIGGGFALKTSHTKLFLLVNNFKGFYHPADTNNFGVSFGAQINVRSSLNYFKRKKRGKFDQYLPFYRDL